MISGAEGIFRRGAIAGFFALALLAGPAAAQPVRPKLTDAPVKTADHVYKKTPEGELALHGFFPTDWKPTDKRPVVVFFFGGGWKNGSYTQFVPHAEYFASRGLVCATADYRVANQHHTTPDACIEDAKSAVRWLRAQNCRRKVEKRSGTSSRRSRSGGTSIGTPARRKKRSSRNCPLSDID
jgi:acetyl esterase/lipase